MPDPTLARWRKERNRRRKNVAALRARVKAVLARIKKLNEAILRRKQKLQTTPGEKAADYLLRFVGKTEIPPGSNDAPWLRQWEAGLPHDRLDWMIPGNPYCGFACVAAYWYGAKVMLPDNTVYTPAIVSRAKNGDGFSVVPQEKARKGDLVVFNFPGGNGVADHVGLALGPPVFGQIKCVEANTSGTLAGSQDDGGGVFVRTRPTSLIAVVARPM